MKSISTVTIVGANGTMGRNIAAIFASFGNANVYLVSRSLEKSNKAKESAYQSVRAESVKNRMIPADYSQLEECVSKSDLIFEACAENWAVKENTHRMISDVLNNLPIDSAASKVICSGTSGLSITSLAELYDEPLRSHVIGMHFFNPPYQMTLCELTPTVYTNRELFKEIHHYTERILLRTTVEVKDSPAFLGNRIGFQFINEAMQLAEKYKYNGGIDYIDAILGPFTGRAMAPLVTAHFVGLDVHKAIVDNLYENTHDFSYGSFILPNYVENLVNDGKLGRKDVPVVKGYGHRTAPMLFDKKMQDNADSEYVLPWTRQAVLDAYRRSGLTVDDIDVFETHDCFTSSEYAAISAFGITEPGKEYEAVENGVIAFDGEKPINPSGGLIGCGHPVGASGCRMFLDTYKQVSGNAGDYQVMKNGNLPRNGMMLNIGGTATTNYVFVVGR